MTLREILNALWRRRSILAVGVAVSALLGLGLVFLQGSNYRATTQVLLRQSAVAAPGGDGLLTQQKLNLIAVTLARTAESPEFVRAAVGRVRLDRGDATVSADAVQTASIVRIEVSAKSKQRVVSVAKAVADQLQRTIDIRFTDLPAELAIETDVLEQPSARFASANPMFAVFAALVAGFAIAATAALIIEST